MNDRLTIAMHLLAANPSLDDLAYNFQLRDQVIDEVLVLADKLIAADEARDAPEEQQWCDTCQHKKEMHSDDGECTHGMCNDVSGGRCKRFITEDLETT